MRKSITVILILATTLLCGCGYPSTQSLRDNADFRFKRGEFQQASYDYTEIVARFPGDWSAQHRLGECLLELGDPNRARQGPDPNECHEWSSTRHQKLRRFVGAAQDRAPFLSAQLRSHQRPA